MANENVHKLSVVLPPFPTSEKGGTRRTSTRDDAMERNVSLRFFTRTGGLDIFVPVKGWACKTNYATAVGQPTSPTSAPDPIPSPSTHLPAVARTTMGGTKRPTPRVIRDVRDCDDGDDIFRKALVVVVGDRVGQEGVVTSGGGVG